jgi:hypothetical protein
MIGCLGGLIGASFVNMNLSLTDWRFSNVKTKMLKIFEALFVAACMTSIQIILPLLWNRCTPLPVDMEEWSNQEKVLVDELVPLYCNSETHYNELASLYLGGLRLLSVISSIVRSISL